MGTRGIHGFFVNGKLKVSYNQYDMYPSGVGTSLCDELRGLDLDEVRKAAKRIRMITGKRAPSKANRDKYAPIGDMGVASQSDADWYCLLRSCHGTIKPWVEGVSELTSYDYAKGKQVTTKVEPPVVVEHMLDSSDFPADSLFCEWGYVVNVDDNTFEVYRGFQKAPHNAGRFADMDNAESEEFYPIKLVATFDLDDLPTSDDMGRLEDLINGEDDDGNKMPSIEGAAPRIVGKMAMQKETTLQERSVSRIEQCGALACYESNDEPDTQVKDMLADLRHYCAAKGLDFGELSVKAEDYVRDEVELDS